MVRRKERRWVARGDFKKLPREVLSEYGRRGAQGAAEAKRRKKRMRETLEVIMQMPLKARGQEVDVEDVKAFAQLENKNMTVEQAVMVAQVMKALKGDTRAADFIRKATGQDVEEW